MMITTSKKLRNSGTNGEVKNTVSLPFPNGGKRVRNMLETSPNNIPEHLLKN